MSYLEMVRRLENQHAEYRNALRRYWARPEDTETYQRLLLLLDDLGVTQAETLRSEEVLTFERVEQSEAGHEQS